MNTTSIAHSIRKNSFVLGIFALCTAGMIAVTFQTTSSRIEAAQLEAARKALLEILPASTHDNNLLESTIPLNATQRQRLDLSEDTAVVHVAKQNGRVVAFILPSVAPDGYSGDIKLLVGVNIDGTVAGVRVLQHRETPGLGDKIELAKSDWILSFNGLSLLRPAVDQWTVKKNGGYFDQMTGATITPRSVVHQIRDTLAFVTENRTTWIEQSAQQSLSSGAL